ncbi:MAG TPA: hypothetical protein VM097_09000 [Mycobacteriales bacterium]|nr:hypothetical protein [Mycobacteriales bacterium]
MADLDAFRPTTAGAEAALRAGRRRRTAKLAGAGSSSLAMVLGAVLVLGAGSPRPGKDELVPAEASPSMSTTTSASPSPQPSTSTAHAPSRRPEGPADPVLGTPSPGAASAPPAQHRSTTPRVSPVTRVQRDMDSTDLCDGDPNVAAYGYCLRAFQTGVIHRGHAVAVGGEVCVPRTGRTTTLRTESTREADIAVSDRSGVLWQGGEGLRYTKPGPTITVEPGSCVGWTSPWDTRDREGFVVPPGTYELTLGIGTSNGVSTWGGTLTVED